LSNSCSNSFLIAILVPPVEPGYLHKLSYTLVAASFLSSVVLFERDGRFGELQRNYTRPYPTELVRHIIDKNYPLLDPSVSSYPHQIETAAFRGDLVSVNHRIAAYLASYFDVLFAVMRMLHPGEKKIMKILSRTAVPVPPGLADNLLALFSIASTGAPGIGHVLETLTGDLRNCIIENGFSDLPT